MYTVRVLTADGFHFDMLIPQTVEITHVQLTTPEGELGNWRVHQNPGYDARAGIACTCEAEESWNPKDHTGECEKYGRGWERYAGYVARDPRDEMHGAELEATDAGYVATERPCSAASVVGPLGSVKCSLSEGHTKPIEHWDGPKGVMFTVPEQHKNHAGYGACTCPPPYGSSVAPDPFCPMHHKSHYVASWQEVNIAHGAALIQEELKGVRDPNDIDTACVPVEPADNPAYDVTKESDV